MFFNRCSWNLTQSRRYFSFISFLVHLSRVPSVKSTTQAILLSLDLMQWMSLTYFFSQCFGSVIDVALAISAAQTVASVMVSSFGALSACSWLSSVDYCLASLAQFTSLLTIFVLSSNSPSSSFKLRFSCFSSLLTSSSSKNSSLLESFFFTLFTLALLTLFFAGGLPLLFFSTQGTIFNISLQSLSFLCVSLNSFTRRLQGSCFNTLTDSQVEFSIGRPFHFTQQTTFPLYTIRPRTAYASRDIVRLLSQKE